MPRVSAIALLCLALAAGGVAGCGALPAGSTRPLVLAGENTWGSIAAQIAGGRVLVRSLITDPGTDPHSYEPTAADGRTAAQASLVIANGIGYDSWLTRLVAAGGGGARVLDIGRLLGRRAGENPHVWYSPPAVRRVAVAIAAALERLDPRGRAGYAARLAFFERVGLARYDALRSEIRRRFAGVAVGYSESIFAPLGQDLGLRLLTPASFATAVAEGTEVTAADIRTVEDQTRRRAIAVWVVNDQNLTPEVQRVDALARASGVPVATVSETLSPAGASFQSWQDAQLRGLLDALHRATGR